MLVKASSKTEAAAAVTVAVTAPSVKPAILFALAAVVVSVIAMADVLLVNVSVSTLVTNVAKFAADIDTSVAAKVITSFPSILSMSPNVATVAPLVIVAVTAPSVKLAMVFTLAAD